MKYKFQNMYVRFWYIKSGFNGAFKRGNHIFLVQLIQPFTDLTLFEVNI